MVRFKVFNIFTSILIGLSIILNFLDIGGFIPKIILYYSLFTGLFLNIDKSKKSEKDLKYIQYLSALESKLLDKKNRKTYRYTLEKAILEVLESRTTDLIKKNNLNNVFFSIIEKPIEDLTIAITRDSNIIECTNTYKLKCLHVIVIDINNITTSFDIKLVKQKERIHSSVGLPIDIPIEGSGLDPEVLKDIYQIYSDITGELMQIVTLNDKYTIIPNVNNSIEVKNNNLSVKSNTSYEI